MKKHSNVQAIAAHWSGLHDRIEHSSLTSWVYLINLINPLIQQKMTLYVHLVSLPHPLLLRDFG
jgi:hypothetical protein